jgi:hypothetical protein
MLIIPSTVHGLNAGAKGQLVVVEGNAEGMTVDLTRSILTVHVI